MNKKLMLLCTAALLHTVTFLHAEQGGVANNSNWSYEGKTGPEHWAELSSENKLCGVGKNQSPVNIDIKRVVDINQEPIKLNYGMLVPDRIKNTGHSIQVDMRSGGSITIDGKSFELKQLRFHTPSENTVNGKHFPMEVHFIHKSESGELAVLTIMFIPGKADRTLINLWKKMPFHVGESARLSASDLKNIETESSFSQYYRFNGSLTTPPCTEGIRWIVMQVPMTISKDQVKTLQKALKHPNNRPVQKINARIIVQ